MICNDCTKLDLEEETNKVEGKYCLTLWGCLVATMMDYDLEFNRQVSGKIGMHFMNDLMDLLVKHGHLVKDE